MYGTSPMFTMPVSSVDSGRSLFESWGVTAPKHQARKEN